MQRHVKVAIIGAGSAGLSALRQVKKKTEDYILIDKGPLGTTCARVGCMPSKALIQVAGDFHRRRLFTEAGITGSEHLACDIPAVLRYVRYLRALAIQQHMKVSDLLQMPFYHPTAEEAVRAALLDAARKLHVGDGSSEPALCGSCPEPPLC